MTPAIPTFAVVGAVNHGKSSIVAALAEDDGVRVSPMPGETVVARPHALRDLLVLVDTPGFQNARKALADLRQDLDGPPLDVFRRFVERHRSDPAFDAECRLLQPIVDGAGVVYVVDASQPLREIHLAEMEILRLTGAPRLAIVNRSAAASHVDAWKARLDQHFNLVRLFDSHDVTSADRIDLIESLASIERSSKAPLREAARLIAAERDRRVVEAAALIADLVIACLGHVEREGVVPGSDAVAREAQAARIRQRYGETIAAMEHDAHRRIIALYAHRFVEPDGSRVALRETDLFADETWRLFGLETRQLLGLSTVAGGVAGAGVDAMALGHSLGLGAAIGAAAGAGGAYLLGRRRPELSVHWPSAALPSFVRAAAGRRGLRFAGGDLVVGPYKAENFPWILIDRAQCLFAYVHVRSHARRDAAAVDSAALLAVLDARRLTVRHWSDATRARCRRAYAGGRGGDDRIRERGRPLGDAIAASLADVVRHERDIADAIR